eukprot:14883235-Heterocapsa_arctica.AAC.1
MVMGIHSVTDYTVRTEAGDSEMYLLLRGVREGCPTSGILFTVYHAIVMRVLAARVPKVDAQCDVERPLPRGPPRPGQRAALKLSHLCFVDDTSFVTRRSEQKRVEELMAEVMLHFGLRIHPGKTERLLPGWVSGGAGEAEEGEPEWEAS